MNSVRLVANSVIFGFLVLQIGCAPAASSKAELAPIGAPGNGRVIKSRTTHLISSDMAQSGDQMMKLGMQRAVSQSISQSLTENAAISTMTVDWSNFAIPALSNTQIDFGNIAITNLYDDNLNVCGDSGTERCGTAWILIYTIGVGEGFRNTLTGYGAPLEAGQVDAGPEMVGFEDLNATILQTYTIPSSQNVLTHADFPNPTYNIQSDFTEAPAGTYEATFVIEYYLSL